MVKIKFCFKAEIKLLNFCLILVFFGMMSCTNDKKVEAEKIVAKWIGKEITFPTDIECSYLGSDTICPDSNAPYKILLYTDSTGCTSCKLHLYKWNTLIEEANELMKEKVSFHFYFYPKDEKELKFLFKRDDFKQTVYIDRQDKLNSQNKLPKDLAYQCFLLDKDNRVILIGNPAENLKLWDLYKQAVMGQEITEKKQIKLTTIEIEEAEIELKDLKVNRTSIVTFTLNNTGEAPLAIKDITAPCGCTIPEWERKPINPGNKTEIRVKVIPEAQGYFRKSITVFCNTEEGIIKLTIKGLIKDE